MASETAGLERGNLTACVSRSVIGIKVKERRLYKQKLININVWKNKRHTLEKSRFRYLCQNQNKSAEHLSNDFVEAVAPYN